MHEWVARTNANQELAEKAAKVFPSKSRKIHNSSFSGYFGNPIEPWQFEHNARNDELTYGLCSGHSIEEINAYTDERHKREGGPRTAAGPNVPLRAVAIARRIRDAAMGNMLQSFPTISPLEFLDYLNKNMTETTQTTGANILADVNSEAAHDAASMERAAASYSTLRPLIAKYLVEALRLVTAGEAVLLEEQLKGKQEAPISFSMWRRALPEAAQQYYNCNTCRQLWAKIGSLCLLSPDGTITYPMVQAFGEAADTDGIAAQVLLSAASADRAKPRFIPATYLDYDALKKKEVGGFDHFYAFEDTEEHGVTVRGYNDSLLTFNDVAYVEVLFKQMLSPNMNPDTLEKVFIYIERELGKLEHTAFRHRTELVKIVREVRAIGEKSSMAMVYLWALTNRLQLGWLHHVNKSVLGIVLEGVSRMKDASPTQVLMHVKEQMAQATAAENFKQKTAEAPEAAIQQTFKFLSENNLKGTLLRKLMHINDVKSAVWLAPEQRVGVAEHAQLTEPQQPVEASLDNAFAAVLKEKNGEAQLNAELDAVIGAQVVQRGCSMLKFIEDLPKFREISLNAMNSQGLPVLATDAAAEGDHDELMEFDKEIGEYATLLSTAQPYPYPALYSLAKYDPENEGSLRVGRPQALPVQAVIKSHRVKDADPSWVLHIENFAQNFAQGLKEHGSCVTPSAIRGKHYGMAASLQELSRKVPLQATAGRKAVGGVYIMPGLIFDVVTLDGGKETIKLTSYN